MASLLALSVTVGVPQFVFVQWVAPLVSEFPEMASTFYWARTVEKAPMALMNMVSSNINQWTLLPAMLAVFKAEEWDNFGLMTVDSSMIYSIVDVLLGGDGICSTKSRSQLAPCDTGAGVRIETSRSSTRPLATPIGPSASMSERASCSGTAPVVHMVAPAVRRAASAKKAAMREAAACLAGTHDFSAFRSSQCQARSPVRNITDVRIGGEPHHCGLGDRDARFTKMSP